MSDPKELTEAEWRERLTDMQFRVLRKHGTERAFTGELWDNKADGTYACAGCGHPLFGSDTKYVSGTGWPSFWAPLAPDSVATQRDWKMLLPRNEVHCARCNGHLGHVFSDGPDPSGKRYCMNSAALSFQQSED